MKKLIIIFFCLFSITIAQETLKESIVHDDLVREYIVRIPSSYDNKVPIPLVLCFHGYGGTATEISYTNFNDVSDTANFIVVYPQGTLLKRKSHWNVGGWTLDSKIDDVGFISSLLDSLSERYNINQSRIYSTGMSNGGYMGYHLACNLSSKFAAIASVTGSMTNDTFNECDPTHPTPILQIHGLLDFIVPYDGNAGSKSIPDVINYWVNYNSCNLDPETLIKYDDYSLVVYETYSNCLNDVNVKLILHPEMGHDWPSTQSYNINASSEIWNFVSMFDLYGLIN